MGPGVTLTGRNEPAQRENGPQSASSVLEATATRTPHHSGPAAGLSASEENQLRGRVRALLAEMRTLDPWGDKESEHLERKLLDQLRMCVLDEQKQEELEKLPKRMCAYEFKPGDIAWNCKVCQVIERCRNHGSGQHDSCARCYCVGGRNLRDVQRLLHLERPRRPRGVLLLHA